MSTATAEFIKTYQSLVVGVVGFGGVILTLAVNAYFARAQEKRREQREAGALRKALSAELKVQREALQNAVDGIEAGIREGDDSDRALYSIKLFAEVFEKSTDKLGVLSASELSAVFNAYLPLRSLPSKLRIISGGRGSNEGDWVEIQHTFRTTVRELHHIYIPPIDKAMAALRDAQVSRRFFWMRASVERV